MIKEVNQARRAKSSYKIIKLKRVLLVIKALKVNFRLVKVECAYQRLHLEKSNPIHDYILQPKLTRTFMSQLLFILLSWRRRNSFWIR